MDAGCGERAHHRVHLGSGLTGGPSIGMPIFRIDGPSQFNFDCGVRVGSITFVEGGLSEVVIPASLCFDALLLRIVGYVAVLGHSML